MGSDRLFRRVRRCAGILWARSLAHTVIATGAVDGSFYKPNRLMEKAF